MCTNDMPVSVVIPTYNRAKLIGPCVESVLDATREGDEVLVIDDGSSDATEEALASYNSRIRYLRIPKSGAGAARNYGVRAARHDLVAFNDSDDLWMPDKLQLQRTVLRCLPDVLFCFSDFVARCSEGSIIRHRLDSWHDDQRSWDEIIGPGVWFSRLGKLPPGRDDFRVHYGNIYLQELERNYVSTITVVARRAAAGKALCFTEGVAWGEDVECFAKLSGAGRAAYLDCETACQLDHSGPRLSDADVYDRATLRLGMLQRVWGTDLHFLKNHRTLYDRAVRRVHLIRARSLIMRGNTRGARRELEAAGGGPLSYRALAALPGALARRAMSLGQRCEFKRDVP